MHEVFRHNHDCLAATGVVGSLTLAEADYTDPETWLASREEAFVLTEILAFVMDSLGEHRYGTQFIRHVLFDRSWQDLEGEHGVKANTLSKAFGHTIRRLGKVCRQRVRCAEHRARPETRGLEVRHG